MNCTCPTCGTISYGVTRKFAENQIKAFNEYYDSLTREDQETLYGFKKSDIKNYEYCACGNHYKNLKVSEPNEIPDGGMLNPVLEVDE